MRSLSFRYRLLATAALLALPFSLTGAFLAMKITDTSVNIYSMIGILLLMGIVKKNSILLVEFTNHKRAEGFGVRAACCRFREPARWRERLPTSQVPSAGAPAKRLEETP